MVLQLLLSKAALLGSLHVPPTTDRLELRAALTPQRWFLFARHERRWSDQLQKWSAAGNVTRHQCDPFPGWFPPNIDLVVQVGIYMLERISAIYVKAMVSSIVSRSCS